MNLGIIDWVIIISFLVISLLIGLRYRKQASNSLTDFFLAGRNLPWYIAGISMVATTFAADTPLAITEMVADNGISKNWLWWSFLTGGMLTTFFFARLWRKANVLTELELIGIRYSGKPSIYLRGFKAVYLGIFMNCIIIGWVNLALNSLLVEFFAIPQDIVIWYTAGIMLIAVIYSSLSGLKGVAITDTLQFVIAMIGCIILAIVVLNSEQVGGIEGLKKTLPPDYFNFFPKTGSAANTGATLTLSIGAFLSFITIQWWASWYPGAEPGGGGYIAQRMMSTKNEKHSFLATIFFQFAHYCLRPWPWIIVALCAVSLYDYQYNGSEKKLFEKIEQYKNGISPKEMQFIYNNNPEVKQNALVNPNTFNQFQNEGIHNVDDLKIVMPEIKSQLLQNKKLAQTLKFEYNSRMGYVLVMNNFLPTGLKGLLLVAFLAAYLSTISTQLNWGTSYIINDLYLLIRKAKIKSQKQVVNLSRIVTFFVMIFSLFVTTQLHTISGVWEFIMECGAGLGLVLILRWYWWRINAWSEIVATIAPFIGYSLGHYVIAPLMGNSFIENKGTYIFTVLFTTVSWLTATFITKPTDEKVLIDFYKRVRPDGAWKPFSKSYGTNKSKNKKGMLLVCWISSVIMIYALLFTTGKLIFHLWYESIIWLIVAFVGALILGFAIKRTNILMD